MYPQLHRERELRVPHTDTATMLSSELHAQHTEQSLLHAWWQRHATALQVLLQALETDYQSGLANGILITLTDDKRATKVGHQAAAAQLR